MNVVRGIALGAVAVAVFATQDAAAGGFYVQPYGGANWDEVIDAPFIKETNGGVLGVAVGTKLDAVPGLRIEADLSFRQNEVKAGPFKIDHNTVALMGNAVYDFDVNLKGVTPYALVGVGYARTEGTFEDIALAKVEASDITFQLGAGVNFAVTDNMSAGIGYRYFESPDIEVLGLPLSRGSNHSLIASVTFGFN